MSLLPVRARPNHSMDQDVSCQRLLSVDQKPSFYPIHRTWTFGKERAGGARLPDEGEQRQQQQQRRSRLVFPPAALAALVPATAFRALPHARQPMAASAPVVRRPTVRLTVTASAPAVRCPTVRQTVTASASEVRSPTVRLTVLRLTVRATATKEPATPDPVDEEKAPAAAAQQPKRGRGFAKADSRLLKYEVAVQRQRGGPAVDVIAPSLTPRRTSSTYADVLTKGRGR
jgi:hypothetical protein